MVKGFRIPDPIEGYPLLCIQVRIPDAPEYRQAFWGTLKEYTDWWKWEQAGRGDTRAAEVARYLKPIVLRNVEQMIADCGSGDGIMLRQNPDNPCQLQQLVEGEWVLAFDFGLCKSDSATNEILYETYVQGLRSNSICGTAQSDVLGGRGSQGFMQGGEGSEQFDEYRWQGMCSVLANMVEASLQIADAQLDEANAGVSKANLILGVVAATFAITGSGGALAPFVIGLGIAGFSAGALLATENLEAVMNDEEAKNAVVCRVLDNLGNARTATLDSLKQAFEYVASGNEERIRRLVSVLLAQDNAAEVFGAFMGAFSDETKLASVGRSSYNCGCEQVTLYIDTLIPRAMRPPQVRLQRLTQNRYRLVVPEAFSTGEAPPWFWCGQISNPRIYVTRRGDLGELRQQFRLQFLKPEPPHNPPFNDVLYMALDPSWENFAGVTGSPITNNLWGLSFCPAGGAGNTYEFIAYLPIE